MTETVAGVDGCPAGWMVALLGRRDGDLRLSVVPRLADLFAAFSPAVVAVDMPIGLPDRIGPGGRGPEEAVRPLLGGRQSSVYSVPARAAVYAQNFRAACAAALATSEPPRMVSKQLFAIAPKMRELDGLLRAAPDLVCRVFEVHPEVAFWRLNGERALAEPKKVKGRPYGPGLALRCDLLMAAGIPPQAIDQGPPAGAAIDDLLDALACAVTARRIRDGLARPFPDPPGRDAFGLPMAIWA
jgi:predicted RNase H-like nuclease